MTKKQLIAKAEGLGLGAMNDLDRLGVETIKKMIATVEKAKAASEKAAKEDDKPPKGPDKRMTYITTVDDLMRLGRLNGGVSE